MFVCCLLGEIVVHIKTNKEPMGRHASCVCSVALLLPVSDHWKCPN